MFFKKRKSKVTFVYNPDSQCRKVALTGDFNDWHGGLGKMV